MFNYISGFVAAIPSFFFRMFVPMFVGLTANGTYDYALDIFRWSDSICILFSYILSCLLFFIAQKKERPNYIACLFIGIFFSIFNSL